MSADRSSRSPSPSGRQQAPSSGSASSESPNNGFGFGIRAQTPARPRDELVASSPPAAETIPERRALSLAPEDAAAVAAPSASQRADDNVERAPSPPPVDKPKKPVLRLAMLDTQEQDRIRRQQRNGGEPSTAPVRGVPLELPESGYFAPRDTISRSSTTTDKRSPLDSQQEAMPKTGDRRKRQPGLGLQALRFASRDSVHTIQTGAYSGDSSGDEGGDESRLYTPISRPMQALRRRDRATGGSADAAALGRMPPPPPPGPGDDVQPPGLRRRVTQARINLQQLGRAFDTATGGHVSDSDESDTNASSQNTDEHMEKLLDRHANSAANPPSSNIAANNADITNTPEFYPVNPSAQNPGVIHVNMSGHAAARNIVEAALGGIGSSTARYKSQEALDGSTITPADLEAGKGEKAARPGFASDGMPVSSGYANMLPPLQPSSMGLGRTPTTLRGVYANLTKLQSRMAEHQELRDRRARELRAKEVKRKREEELKRKREEELKRKREEDRKREDLPRSIVGARIRDMHDRIPGKLAEIREKARQHHIHHHHSKSAVNMHALEASPGSDEHLRHGDSEPPLQLPPHGATVAAEGEDGGFLLRKFQTAPRPESVAMYLSGMGDSDRAEAEEYFKTRPTPKSRSRPGTPHLSPHGSPPTTAPAATTPAASARQSPATTPGWDEIMASSGMLTSGSIGGGITPGAAGSRMSTASGDSTLMSLEAEKQRILAQLEDIFNRQNFLLVASRALMAFGAPLHRLEANLIAIALNLDVEATFAALPGIILITFGDEDTRSSETYVVRVASGYDMHRLGRTNRVIRRVLKSRITVGQGVRNLERILATPPIYPWWIMIADYVLCSFFICPLFWKGSWTDAGVSAMIGFIVGLLQLLAGRFANYANLFEISSAFIVSFIAALLQDYICFGPVSFSGVVMLLPGLALTTSIIEMASRNMISGTVRLVFAMSRCFFLGYGISVGATLGTRVLGRSTDVDLLGSDSMGKCIDGLNKFWWFLFLPAVALCFNVSISAHWRQWPMMVFSACLAYTVSYFAGLSTALSSLAPAIAAFAMGLFGNILASFSNHRSAVEPILGGVQLLVPGSLGLKTVLTFITNSGTSSGSFLYNIFSTSLSIAAGLFLSSMVVFPNRKKRVGLMTF
ncbi:pheromone-regulated protein prm10 [Coemansia sp. RSA 2399]|nr:pheromone-regulated protein prm10 [Coemansia sp. RSA 2399]KAJ1908532.1 pheromone-regulated protein prm10 [Coemansia sp. IMI 209127]